jgi:hypothetical protein
VKDKEIYPYLLNNTDIGSRDNYGDLVLAEGFDTIVLIYSTEEIHNP